MVAITEAAAVPQTQNLKPLDNFNFELTEDWVVKTDATRPTGHGVDPLFFIGDPLFPAIGSDNSYEATLKFRTFENATQEASDLWRFTGMTWSSLQRPFANDFQPTRYDDETKRDISWTFSALQYAPSFARVADPTGASKFTRPVPDTSFSTNPEPIATKEVGEPIEGYTTNRYIPTALYVRNQEFVPTGLVTGDVVGVVNSDPVTIDGAVCAPLTVMLQNCAISTEKQSIVQGPPKSVKRFRTVSYTLAVKHDGWDLEALNAGFYELVENSLAADEIQRIKKPNGWDEDDNKAAMTPVSSPQLLDVNGKAFDTKPPLSGWIDKVHYRVFRTYRLAAFAGFNFT